MHEGSNPSTNLEYFRVRYTPEFQTPVELENYCCHGQLETISNRHDSFNYFHSFCANAGVNLTFEPTMSNTFQTRSDIILLITFNHDPTSVIIETIHHLYRGHFRNMVFCGNKVLGNLLNEHRAQSKRFVIRKLAYLNYSWSKRIEV